MIISRQHDAYMRALTEGLPRLDAARQFLDGQHGTTSLAAHRRVIDAARGMVCRRGDAARKLIGVDLPTAHSVEEPPSIDA